MHHSQTGSPPHCIVRQASRQDHEWIPGMRKTDIKTVMRVCSCKRQRTLCLETWYCGICTFPFHSFHGLMKPLVKGEFSSLHVMRLVQVGCSLEGFQREFVNTGWVGRYVHRTYPALVVLYSTFRIGLHGSGFFPSLGCFPNVGQKKKFGSDHQASVVFFISFTNKFLFKDTEDFAA